MQRGLDDLLPRSGPGGGPAGPAGRKEEGDGRQQAEVLLRLARQRALHDQGQRQRAGASLASRLKRTAVPQKRPGPLKTPAAGGGGAAPAKVRRKVFKSSTSQPRPRPTVSPFVKRAQADAAPPAEAGSPPPAAAFVPSPSPPPAAAAASPAEAAAGPEVINLDSDDDDEDPIINLSGSEDGEGARGAPPGGSSEASRWEAATQKAKLMELGVGELKFRAMVAGVKVVGLLEKHEVVDALLEAGVRYEKGPGPKTEPRPEDAEEGAGYPWLEGVFQGSQHLVQAMREKGVTLQSILVQLEEWDKTERVSISSLYRHVSKTYRVKTNLKPAVDANVLEKGGAYPNGWVRLVDDSHRPQCREGMFAAAGNKKHGKYGRGGRASLRGKKLPPHQQRTQVFEAGHTIGVAEGGMGWEGLGGVSGFGEFHDAF